MARVIFHLQQAFSPEAMQARKERMASVLRDQVIRRLHDGGDEDGPFAPLDFSRPDGTTGNPLLRTGAHLANTLTTGTTPNSCWVGSRFLGARIHQYGTVGKGGKLPSIRPVNAKALFIPMSKRGAKSVLEMGKRVTRTKRKGKVITKPLEHYRLSTGGDFLLVQKVDIRARPYMRLTANNRRELVRVGFGGGK